MRFALPYMLWLLLLVPALGAYLFWATEHRRQILARFGTQKAIDRLQLGRSLVMMWVRNGLYLVGFAALLISLARPQWGFHERRIISRGVDIMIAIDTSNSMMARDFQPDRLSRAKELLRNLIWDAKGSRVGIVAFAGTSVVMCPLTLDYDMASTSLKAVDVNTVSAQGTNIAAAIEAAINAFEIAHGNDRILILLTDGEQTEQLDRLDAAVKKAAENGVKIFAIGIGSKDGATIPTLRGPLRDRTGKVVITKMDFTQLQNITQKTKGEAIRAEKMGAGEIAEISAQLAKFKGQKQADKSVRVYHDRYPIFLAVAALCFLLEALLRYGPAWRWMRRRSGKLAALLVLPGLLLMAGSGWAYPGEAFMQARQGYQKYKAGEYEQAMQAYQRALELKPQDPHLLYNLGASAARAKKTPEAKKAFRSVYDAQNPRLNAQALFGATTLDHREVRDVIKEKLKKWTEDIKGNTPDAKTAREEVQQNIDKLKTILEEYKKSLLATPDDVDMKANFELAKRDLEELEKLLEQNPPQNQPNQQPQDQKNEEKDKQDKENKDNQQGEGQSNQNQGSKGEKPEDKQNKPEGQKEGENQQGQGEGKPTPTPKPEGEDQQNRQGQQNPENQPGKPGEEPEKKNEPSQQGTPTPTPSPTPGKEQGPGQGQEGQGAPNPNATPVPVGQMSKTDVDRLLNTLPPEDQQALQLMFGAGARNDQDEMQNEW